MELTIDLVNNLGMCEQLSGKDKCWKHKGNSIYRGKTADISSSVMGERHSANI